MKKLILLYAIVFYFVAEGQVSDSSWHFSAGLSFKKFAGFYSMGGACAEVNSKRLAKERLALGVNITSSSVGSAFANNGIPVLATELYGRWIFRPAKKLQPFVMLNLGYAKAFPGSDKYNHIATSSLLVSPEAGLSWNFIESMQLQGGVGYHIFAGSGLKGPGFIYPVCLQLRLLYFIPFH